MDIQELRIECISDLASAEKVWRQFSPNETIYDSWEFRALFHKYHQKEIRFYVGFVDSVMIGAMPLQYNAQKGVIEFFGGDYMEDNHIFLLPEYEQYRSKFYEYLKTLKEKFVLEYIRGEDEFTKTLEIADYKYVLPLEGMLTFEDYLQKYYKSHGRKKLKKKFKDIETLNICIERNNIKDLETLFSLNIKLFGEHSAFNDRPFHKEIFYELCQLPYPFFLNVFCLNGEKVGASLALFYNGTMEYFSSGVDREKVNGLSDYINKIVFEDALQGKAKFIDAFVGSYGWKEEWHFQKIPQYKFITTIE